MPLKLTLVSVKTPSAENIVEAVIRVVASGNYPAAGDTLDFTTLAGQIAPDGGMLDADIINNLPLEAWAESETGGWGASAGGYYFVQLYTNASPNVAKTPKSCLLRAFAAGGTEESGGAYDATIKNDFIIVHARWDRNPA